MPACHAVLPFDSETEPRRDRGSEAGQPDAAAAADAPALDGPSTRDAERTDRDADADSGAVTFSLCGPEAEGALATYRFEDPDDPLGDLLGAYSGAFGGGAVIELDPLASGPCETRGALRFLEHLEPCTAPCDASEYTTCLPEVKEGRAVLPSELARRSTAALDFWFRLEEPISRVQALISRDALGQEDGGHLTLLLLPKGSGQRDSDLLVLRLQGADANVESDKVTILCASAPSPDVWHHVGVNVGGGAPELFVDGVAAKLDESAGNFSGRPCSYVGTETGLEGNDLPWIVGASAIVSCGDDGPYIDPFVGDIALLRFHEQRRDYAAAFGALERAR